MDFANTLLKCVKSVPLDRGKRPRERVVANRRLEVLWFPIARLSGLLVAKFGEFRVGIGIAPQLNAILGGLESERKVFVLEAEPMRGGFKFFAGVEVVSYLLAPLLMNRAYSGLCHCQSIGWHR